MFESLLLFAMFLLSLSVIACLYRVVKGPSAPDRIIALDTIGYNIIAVVGILSMMLHTHAFLDVILLIGVLAYISTIALAKFIERGVAIEYERDE